MKDAVGLSGEAQLYIAKLKKENDALQSNIIQYEKKVTALEENNQQLKNTNQSLEQRNETLEQKNRVLEEKLKLALFRQFGRHAEKFTGPGQILLFESGEAAASLTDGHGSGAG